MRDAVLANFDARRRVLKERIINRFVRRRRGEQINDADYERETFALIADEMGYVADQQQGLVIAEQRDGPTAARTARKGARRALSDRWVSLA